MAAHSQVWTVHKLTLSGYLLIENVIKLIASELAFCDAKKELLMVFRQFLPLWISLKLLPSISEKYSANILTATFM